MLRGYPKIRTWFPNTRKREKQTRSSATGMRKGTVNLLQTAQVSKIVNPFTRALAPLFYRETKGLLHSENTVALKEYS
jgi:hypothetical protein